MESLEDQIQTYRDELEKKQANSTMALEIPAWGIGGFLGLAFLGIPGAIAIGAMGLSHLFTSANKWEEIQTDLKNNTWLHHIKGRKGKEIKALYGAENIQKGKKGDYTWLNGIKPKYQLPAAKEPQEMPQAEFFSEGFTSGVETPDEPVDSHNAENETPFDMPEDSKKNTDEELIEECQGEEIYSEDVEFVDEEIQQESKGYYFDLNELSDTGSHPILAVVAPRSSGKTTLVRYIAKYICLDYGGTGTALDVASANWEWGKVNLISSYDEMMKEIAFNLLEIERRHAQFRTRLPGENSSDLFSKDLMIFDEWQSTLTCLRILKNLNCEIPTVLESLVKKSGIQGILSRWLNNLDSLSAKVNEQVIFASTGIKSLGFNPEARNNITFIFPGLAGCEMAMSDTHFLKLGTAENAHLRMALNQEFENYARAALVFHRGKWAIAEIPELNLQGELETDESFKAADEPSDSWMRMYEMVMNSDEDEEVKDYLQYMKNNRGNVLNYDPTMLKTMTSIQSHDMVRLEDNGEGSGKCFIL